MSGIYSTFFLSKADSVSCELIGKRYRHPTTVTDRRLYLNHRYDTAGRQLGEDNVQRTLQVRWRPFENTTEFGFSQPGALYA